MSCNSPDCCHCVNLKKKPERIALYTSNVFFLFSVLWHHIQSTFLILIFCHVHFKQVLHYITIGITWLHTLCFCNLHVLFLFFLFKSLLFLKENNIFPKEKQITIAWDIFNKKCFFSFVWFWIPMFINKN